MNYLEEIGVEKKSKDIATALNMEKRLVDRILNELKKEGKVEFIYEGGFAFARIVKKGGSG